MFRLRAIAECWGSQILNDTQCFDNVVGRGRFPGLDGGVLYEVRGIVKSAGDRTTTVIREADIGEPLLDRQLTHSVGCWHRDAFARCR